MELFAEYRPDAAFVATTEQVVPDVAVRTFLRRLQAAFGVDSAKETYPVPEPPEVVSVTEVPIGFVVVAFEIDSSD